MIGFIFNRKLNVFSFNFDSMINILLLST